MGKSSAGMNGLSRIFTRVISASIAIAIGVVGEGLKAYAFPWSTDMFRGAAVQPLEIAPRVMPDGTLPVNGIHYNVHYGQPAGMPTTAAILPMKLELMTVREQNPLKPTTENLAHGKALFETVCAPCHGMIGKGNGTVVHLLKHKPADLLTGVSSNLPDGYIFGYIRNGGIWMPSYNDAMSTTERWQVVLYVRDLEKKYGATAAKAGAAPSAKTQPSSKPEQQALRGLAAEPRLFQPGLGESGTTASLGATQE